MAYDFSPDVLNQIQQRMATGQYASKDDLLRDALRALERQDDDLAAVREAIADMESGDRGKPFDEFVEEFRKRHDIPENA